MKRKARPSALFQAAKGRRYADGRASGGATTDIRVERSSLRALPPSTGRPQLLM